MAEVIDDGPGKGITSIPFLTHSFTKIAPGSETPGVPASEIREIIDPSLKKPDGMSVTVYDKKMNTRECLGEWFFYKSWNKTSN